MKNEHPKNQPPLIMSLFRIPTTSDHLDAAPRRALMETRRSILRKLSRRLSRENRLTFS
jgi:hypothetical protein